MKCIFTLKFARNIIIDIEKDFEKMKSGVLKRRKFMKNTKFKRIAAAVTALIMSAALIPASFAAEVSTKYNKTYIENFNDADTVFGAENSIFVYGNAAATASTVTMVDHAQGGKYMQIASGGSDVQVWTKKGTFKHDVTVVDMKIRAVFGSGHFPLVRLVNNGQKMDTQNGLFRYFNNNKTIRSYNQTNHNVYNDVANSTVNEWTNVRIILDSVNKKITTVFNGSQATTASEMSSEWDNSNVQLCFQAAAGSTIMLDDVVVSDGAYMDNVYMDEDFEHISQHASGKEATAIGNNHIYGIIKTVNPTLKYDKTENNSYLDIANTLVYSNLFGIEAGKPVVFEFRLKTDVTTNGKVYLRQSTSVVPGLFTIEKGVVDGESSDVNVADGKFHTYRAVFTTQGNGYSISKLVDDTWIGTATSSSNTYAGTEMDIRFDSQNNAVMAIDDLKIYYPQTAAVTCDLDGQTEASTDSAIELVLNTPFNVATKDRVAITANGEAVTFVATPNADKNTISYAIDGGLKSNTTYVITTGEAGLKDMFDQFYNDTITFTTAMAPSTAVVTAVDSIMNAEDDKATGIAIEVTANDYAVNGVQWTLGSNAPFNTSFGTTITGTSAVAAALYINGLYVENFTSDMVSVETISGEVADSVATFVE